jgi:uncharacterized protein with GYD domain
MPIYISRGCFTTDAIKGMMAKAENREEAVSNLFESVGGRLIGWYLTFGPHDWLVIGEFPDNKAAASAILAVRAAAAWQISKRRSPCQPKMQRRPLKLPGTQQGILEALVVRSLSTFGVASRPFQSHGYATVVTLPQRGRSCRRLWPSGYKLDGGFSHPNPCS